LNCARQKSAQTSSQESINRIKWLLAKNFGVARKIPSAGRSQSTKKEHTKGRKYEWKKIQMKGNMKEERKPERKKI
jgi:hypothetical protein